MNALITELTDKGFTVGKEGDTYRCSADFGQIVEFSIAVNANLEAELVIDGQSILPRNKKTSSFQICDRQGNVLGTDADVDDWDSVHE